MTDITCNSQPVLSTPQSFSISGVGVSWVAPVLEKFALMYALEDPTVSMASGQPVVWFIAFECYFFFIFEKQYQLPPQEGVVPVAHDEASQNNDPGKRQVAPP